MVALDPATPRPADVDQVERLESSTPLAQGQVQQGRDVAAAGADGEEVEGDEGDGHVLQELRRGCLAPEPLLQGQERQHATVAKGEQLAVEDPVPGQPTGGRGHLRELPRHVVQVAREEAHLVASAVELGADAVVLVLGPDLRARAG